MIDLGTIAINASTSLVALRNKIFTLTANLQFDEIGATRVTTVVSELIRWIMETNEPARVTVGLEVVDDAFGLDLKFHAKNVWAGGNSKAMNKVFDRVDISKNTDGYETLRIFKKLPSSTFVATDEFVASEKEKIERLSQEDLYEKLNTAFERLKSQSSQLIQTEKMGAVGTMAAGVAHELNNPMMGILNYIQYCLKHTLEDDRRHGVLKDAEKEVKRCTEIINNLLTFSRMEAEGDEGKTEVNTTEIMERVLKLTAYRFRSDNVSIQTHYAKDCPSVWIKANTIQQVFLNLINNALDALKESEKKEITINIRPEGEFLLTTISDTAGGIAQDQIDKIFEPFFTTKSAGKGTGLGLSISRSIIEQHAGFILCESEIGVGTKFTVKLPKNLEKEEDS